MLYLHGWLHSLAPLIVPSLSSPRPSRPCSIWPQTTSLIHKFPVPFYGNSQRSTSSIFYGLQALAITILCPLSKTPVSQNDISIGYGRCTGNIKLSLLLAIISGASSGLKPVRQCWNQSVHQCRGQSTNVEASPSMSRPVHQCRGQSNNVEAGPPMLKPVHQC